MDICPGVLAKPEKHEINCLGILQGLGVAQVAQAAVTERWP